MTNEKQKVPTVVEITADYINQSKSRRTEFLTAKSELDRYMETVNMVKGAMSAFGKGEGNVRIATTNTGNIVLYRKVDKNGHEEAVPSTKKSFNGYYNSTRMYDGKFGADLGKAIPYEVVVRELGADINVNLSKELLDFVNSGLYDLGVTNKNYARQIHNLEMSMMEDYFENGGRLPLTLDEDSITYSNLEEVADSLLRMANILGEDAYGNKTIIRKSDLDTNPLIRVSLIHKVWEDVGKKVKSKANNMQKAIYDRQKAKNDKKATQKAEEQKVEQPQQEAPKSE